MKLIPKQKENMVTYPTGFEIIGKQHNAFPTLHDCLVDHFVDPLKPSGGYYITVEDLGCSIRHMLCYVVKEDNGQIYHKALFYSYIGGGFDWFPPETQYLPKFELYVG